jgi:hypothetical protein
MSGMSMFMSDPRWRYDDPSGVPEGDPGRTPGQVRVVRKPRRVRGIRLVTSPWFAS